MKMKCLKEQPCYRPAGLKLPLPEGAAAGRLDDWKIIFEFILYLLRSSSQ